MNSLRNFNEFEILIINLEKELDSINDRYNHGLINIKDKIDLTVELSLRIKELIECANLFYKDEMKKRFHIYN